MIVSLLAAMDEAGGIGFENRLPWHLSDDLRRFRQLTLGHHILMGRKTWESIGRPLPGRQSIVITRNAELAARLPEGVSAVPSLAEALALAKSRGEEEAFVIGGGQIFALALPYADRFYRTRVHTRGPADAFFPAFAAAEWETVEEESRPAGNGNDFPLTFQTLNRK